MDMSLFNTKFKYISFKESTSNQRLGALHINEMNNVETQFELFENAKVMDRIIYHEKIGALYDMLLSIKVNRAPLFIGVE